MLWTLSWLRLKMKTSRQHGSIDHSKSASSSSTLMHIFEFTLNRHVQAGRPRTPFAALVYSHMHLVHLRIPYTINCCKGDCRIGVTVQSRHSLRYKHTSILPSYQHTSTHNTLVSKCASTTSPSGDPSSPTLAQSTPRRAHRYPRQLTWG